MPENDVEVLRAIKDGILGLHHVFGDVPAGAAGTSLICNSVPKSGTYLLVEMAKRMDFADIGYHLNTGHLEKRTPENMTEHPRPMPALLQVAALRPGQAVPAHIHFSYVLENFLLSEPNRKMLFIIRDPRDLVISWVDYVFSSRAYRSTAWNAYSQDAAVMHHPGDEQRISGSIEGLLNMGLENYLPWIDSPACLTIKFEELYADLSSEGNGETVRRISDYLGQRPENIKDALGKGRTFSGKGKMIGAHVERMNENHRARIAQPDFQKLVLQFGYR